MKLPNLLLILILSVFVLNPPGYGVLSNQFSPGVVFAFAGATCPAGSLLADGSSKLRAGIFAKLFTAISTAHGTADGTHFSLPDYRGRFLRMVDGSAGVDPDKASRTTMATGGNTGNNVGSVQVDDYLAHSHHMYPPQNVGGSTYGFGNSNGLTQAADLGNVSYDTQTKGGNETRPKNAYVNYCVVY